MTKGLLYRVWAWGTIVLMSVGPMVQAGVLTQRTGENYIAWEAEDFDTLAGAWTTITETDASGGQAMRVTSNNGTPPGSGLLTYLPKFASDGHYRLYFKMKTTASGDSLFRPTDFGVDPDGSVSPHLPQPRPNYTWYNDSQAPTTRYQVTVGDVTAGLPLELRIGGRETPFKVDRFVLSKDTGLNSAELDALYNHDVLLTYATADGNWATGANWDNGSPTIDKPTFIGDGRTMTLGSTGAGARALSIGYDNDLLPGNGTLNQSAGDLTVYDGLSIGINTTGASDVTGTYNVTSGTLTVGTPTTGRANLYVGIHSVSSTDTDASGTLDLSGASQFDAYLSEFIVGRRSTSGGSGMADGTVTLAAANNIDALSILVSESHMWGTVPQSTLILGADNTIRADSFTVGAFRGNALVEFAAPGGILDLAGSTGSGADLWIANQYSATGSPSTGVMDLSDGRFTATLDTLAVGTNLAGGSTGTTTGTLILSDDALNDITANAVVLGGRRIGSTATVTGTLTMRGGTFAVSGNVNEGAGDGVGTSNLNVDGGTMNVTGDLAVDNLRVGHNGRTAGVSVTGDVNVGSSLIVGRRSSNSVNPGVLTDGTLDLSGASSVTVNVDDLYVVQSTSGDPVNGTLTLSTTGPNVINAARIYLGSLNVGSIPDAHAVLHLGQDNTIRTDTFRAGYLKGFADVDIVAGGTLDLAGLGGAAADLRIGDVDTNTTTNPKASTVDLTGGTFNATLDELVIGFHLYPWSDTSTGSGTGTLSFDGGTVTANTVAVGTASINPGNGRHGRGVGTLNLGGTGTLNATTLGLGTGSNRSSGTVNLSGGTLNAVSITQGAGTAIFNFTGGTLHVHDFGFDLVQDGGTLAPGNSPDTTNISGDYDQNAGILEIEINGHDQGDVSPLPFPNDDDIGYDFVNVSGNATLNGMLQVVLLDGFVPQTGDTFDVLAADDITLEGGFSLDQPGGMLAGTFFEANVIGGGGGEILQLSIGVPEPSSLILAVLGLLGLGGCLWRRRARAATR